MPKLKSQNNKYHFFEELSTYIDTTKACLMIKKQLYFHFQNVDN